MCQHEACNSQITGPDLKISLDNYEIQELSAFVHAYVPMQSMLSLEREKLLRIRFRVTLFPPYAVSSGVHPARVME